MTSFAHRTVYVFVLFALAPLFPIMWLLSFPYVVLFGDNWYGVRGNFRVHMDDIREFFSKETLRDMYRAVRHWGAD